MAEPSAPDALPAGALPADASPASSPAEAAIQLCDARALEESGRAVVWNVLQFGQPVGAFALRFEGRVVAYLNRCAHVPIELDWAEGEFFESSGLYLMCSTHGAIYVPESGFCAGGPCKGGRLRPIAVTEHDGNIYWTPDEFKALETEGLAMGFTHVASGPMVRSSYHADRMAADAGYVALPA